MDKCLVKAYRLFDQLVFSAVVFTRLLPKQSLGMKFYLPGTWKEDLQ